MQYICLPTADDAVVTRKLKNLKFFPYFKDALGALDSSHIHTAPPLLSMQCIAIAKVSYHKIICSHVTLISSLSMHSLGVKAQQPMLVCSKPHNLLIFTSPPTNTTWQMQGTHFALSFSLHFGECITTLLNGVVLMSSMSNRVVSSPLLTLVIQASNSLGTLQPASCFTLECYQTYIWCFEEMIPHPGHDT